MAIAAASDGGWDTANDVAPITDDEAADWTCRMTRQISKTKMTCSISGRQ